MLVSAPRNYPVGNEQYPSGALMLLGTLLKKQGHKVKVVHMVADQVSIDNYDSLLKEFNPDIVGFTVCTYQTSATRKLLIKTKLFN
jgi:hypothetical protein